MKKLCKNKGPKRVHPSPAPPSSSSTLLSFLPTALLALASSLSPQEQEVLAYLLGSEMPKDKQRSSSSSNNNDKRQKNHPPELGCSCFGCYKSFWARWDSSPNRHVIHLIIDAFEEKLESKEKMVVKVKGKSRRKRGLKKKDELLVDEMETLEKKDDGQVNAGDDDGYVDDDDEVMEEEEEEEKSSMRRFVSWVFGMNN